MFPISFQKANQSHKEAIFNWLKEPHIKEFWDQNPDHPRDIEIFMDGRKKPSPYAGGIFDYWVGLYQNEPYCLVMTSEVKKDDDLPSVWKRHLNPLGKVFSIDFMIGNPKFLNRKLAAPTLDAFTEYFSQNVDREAACFVIDPAEMNPRAKHVYQKAGFKTVDTFFRDFREYKNMKHDLMVKPIYSVEEVTSETQDEMIAYLRKNEDFTMFMLGNFEAHGFKMSEEPNSGNFNLIRNKKGAVVGVFCLARRGSLLIHTDIQKAVFPLVVEACKKEPITIKVVTGEWNICFNLWNYLKKEKVVLKETVVSKEILYSLDLSKANYSKDERIHFLQENDFLQWLKINTDYLQESGFPQSLSKDELKKNYLWKLEKKMIWGLFQEGKIIAIAELNAKAFDLGQVGGVYTLPEFRGQGHSKAVMRQLIMDVKNIHHLKKLIIFTEMGNTPAKKVYESLQVKEAGYYALLFGE